VKSACGVNATPMPIWLSRSFMLVLPLRFTFGSETLRVTSPGCCEPSAVVMAPSAEVVGSVQPLSPAGGSSAIMARWPPR
jgi:hypothetical protein